MALVSKVSKNGTQTVSYFGIGPYFSAALLLNTQNIYHTANCELETKEKYERKDRIQLTFTRFDAAICKPKHVCPFQSLQGDV